MNLEECEQIRKIAIIGKGNSIVYEMGNNTKKMSPKEGMSDNTELLTATFNAHSQVAEDGNRYISEDSFINGLFSKVPTFGKCLFRSFSGNSPRLDISSFNRASSHFSSPLLINSSEDQIKLYLTLFGTDDYITLQEFNELLRGAIDASRAIVKMPPFDMPFDKTFIAFCHSVYNDEKLSTSTSIAAKVQVDSVTNRLNTFLPNIFNDLHEHVLYRLFRRTQLKKQQTSSPSQSLTSCLVETCTSGSSLIGFASLWLLCHVCPPSFLPPSDAGNTSKLARAVENDAWHLLYNSNLHGLSASGFVSRVLAYPGSSLVFLRFSEHLVVIGSDVEWKESSVRRGGFECFLLQLRPSFQLLHGAASESIFFNISNRTFKRALQFHAGGRVAVEVDEGLSTVHFGALEKPLDCMEVWGCGGSGSHEQYASRKEWQRKDVQKQANRKLKADDWKDSADKVLLNYGGIETDHAKRGDL